MKTCFYLLGSSLDSAAKAFVRGWSHRHPLLIYSICPNSRISEENVFSISHILRRNNLVIVSHRYHWGQVLNQCKELFNLPRSQMPAKGQPCKQAFPREQSQSCYVNSSLHIGQSITPCLTYNLMDMEYHIYYVMLIKLFSSCLIICDCG